MDCPYSYTRCSSSPEIDHPTWRIYGNDRKIVWHCRDDAEGAWPDETPYPPQNVRDEYERLLREAGWTPTPRRDIGREFNASLWGSDFDQPCRWGENADGYAVYCTNDTWLYGPRKCHRDRKRWKHEACEGFAPNPDYKGDGQ